MFYYKNILRELLIKCVLPKNVLFKVTQLVIFQTFLEHFSRFGTICTIYKTWKTPMEECYF